MFMLWPALIMLIATAGNLAYYRSIYDSASPTEHRNMWLATAIGLGFTILFFGMSLAITLNAMA